uniref:Zygote arrest 1-like n=1 Tax=Tetraodon nigroviridis TaxID=99883 RepID=H3CX22_TETNG
KAIISQVSPGLPPAVRRALTKECGVQVNAKVDKLIQCSLGPKTLFCLEGDPRASPKLPKTLDPCTWECSTPPVSSLRFARPLSIYSPVFDRRIYPKKPSDATGSEGDPEEARRCVGELQARQRAEDAPGDSKTTAQRPNKESSFQFLEQRYGFFHCKKCNIRWESAYVWCISGTSKVYYKQLCRRCQVGFNPYRVESIVCKQGCSQTCCSCEKKQRHINMKRPHRQDLCCRCRGMALSCDATYSFKYII